MLRPTLQSRSRFQAIGPAALFLAAPASAIDYEQLMKLKKDFEVVRNMIRK